MAEKKYNLVKAASWYTIGNILVKGVSFFVLPIFTRLMSTTDYGIYNVYISYLTIFETVMLLGLSTTVKVSKYSTKVDYEKYIDTICCIPVVLTAFIGIAINLLFSVIPFELLMTKTLWNFIFFTTAMASVSNILCAKMILDGKYISYMLYSAICVLSNIAVSLLLCYTIFKNNDVYMARIYGTAIANTIGTIYLFKSSKSKILIEKKYIKIALCWGIPLLFHSLATVLLTQTDRILVKELSDYSSAGIYGIAVTILTIPVVLQTSLDNAVSPWIFEKLKFKQYNELRKNVSTISYSFFVMVIVFILLSPEIIHIFTDSSYWNSVYSLAPLCMGVVGEVLYCIVINVEYYNEKTKYMMYGTLSAVLINIGLDIVLVKWIGYIGAAYATFISKYLLFVFHFCMAKKIDKNTIIPSKCIFVIFVISIMLLAVFPILIPSVWIRWGISVVISIVVVVLLVQQKETIKVLLKK